MLDGRLEDLAGLHAKIGTDHGIRVADRRQRADPFGIEVGRDDVVAALGQGDQVAGLGPRQHQLGFGVAGFGHEDRDRELGRVDRLVAEHADDAHRAGVEHEALA